MAAPHPCACEGTTCVRGGAVNACGEGLEFELEIRADRVIRAGFTSDACAHVQATAAVAARLAHGLDISELAGLGPERILAELPGLPAQERHTAEFAAQALAAALREYLLRRREEPWRRLYHR
jgi:NifU-like protein involved in Fe-S cluster formation